MEVSSLNVLARLTAEERGYQMFIRLDDIAAASEAPVSTARKPLYKSTPRFVIGIRAEARLRKAYDKSAVRLHQLEP